MAGLRQGEAFGLALDRIDVSAEMITVNQQVVIVDRHPVIAPPKTSASLRDVPMSAFLRAALLRESVSSRIYETQVGRDGLVLIVGGLGVDLLDANEWQASQCRLFWQVSGSIEAAEGHGWSMRLLPFAAATR